jgi:glycosyltransferase involved in cell wall biosynthesis
VLKVLMICPQFKPVIGGYEKAAERLSGALARDGHSVTVLTDRSNPDSPTEEMLDGFRVRRLPTFSTNRLFALHIIFRFLGLAIYLLFNARRYDVIHIHQYGYHSAIAILVARIVRKPVLMKVTNTAGQGIGTTLASGLRGGKLLLKIHKNVGGWVAPSQEAKDEVQSLNVPASRIYQIPNGIDSKTFQPVGEEERARAKRVHGTAPGPLFLFMGRLNPEKNLGMLIRAWSRVNGPEKRAMLAIVGEGPLRDQLHELVNELGCESSVLMPGAVNNPRSWYSASDVFVLSSDNEGLSNSLLEAMSCGLPIISTRVSGSVGVFASAPVGRMVEVGDEEGFAAAIHEMQENPDLRARCGAAARELAETQFALETVANDVAAAYRQVIENAHSLPRT